MRVILDPENERWIPTVEEVAFALRRFAATLPQKLRPRQIIIDEISPHYGLYSKEALHAAKPVITVRPMRIMCNGAPRITWVVVDAPKMALSDGST